MGFHSIIIIVFAVGMMSFCGAQQMCNETTWQENKSSDFECKTTNLIKNGVQITRTANNNQKSNRKDDTNKNNNSSAQDNPWIKLGRSLIHKCEMTSIVLISSNPHFQKQVMKFACEAGLPFFQYSYGDVHSVNTDLSTLSQFFRASYVQNKNHYFVIATDRPGHSLNQVESVFHKGSHGQVALLPHKTRWIVIVWTGRQWEEVVAQQLNSVLDNVVVIKTKEKPKPSFGYELQHLATFMWRQNRTREPSKVDIDSLDTNDCVVFPNIKYGMNGRKLVVGPKVFYKSFLHIHHSHANGTGIFRGLLIDLLEYNSKFMNYTYVLSTAYSKLTWPEYSRSLNNGSMDIGLSTWSRMHCLSYNVSLSHPVTFDAIVGIYRRPDSMRFIESWLLLCPFPPITYFIMFSCIAYVSFLYVMIVGYWGSDDSKHPEQTHSVSVDKLKPNLGGCEDKRMKTTVHATAKRSSALPFYAITYVRFLVLSMNQSYLPNSSRNTSARMVVAVWALGSVIVTAIFSSSITANMAIPKPKLQFRTLEEMLKREDYKPTMIKDGVLDYSTSIAKNNTPLAVLGRRSEVVTLHDHNDEPVDKNLPEYLRNLDHNTVFFHYESPIKSWLDNEGNAKDYVLMDRDPLCILDISIAFAQDSEFQENMSLTIRRLYQTGILSRIMKSHRGFLKTNKGHLPIKNKHPVIELHHLFWVVMIAFMSLFLSLIVLGLETLHVRCSNIVNVGSIHLPVHNSQIYEIDTKHAWLRR